MVQQLLVQGAEAQIIKKGPLVLKKRIKKGYRIPEIDDKLRLQRTRKEAKLLQKASTIIPVPKVKEVSEKSSEITLEYIEGKRLSDYLHMLKNAKEVCKQIGESIAKLHDKEIIHGDLTTSNLILKKDKVYFIDFGLGFQSRKAEDKAVDLHVLKSALTAKHAEKAESLFKAVLDGYKTSAHASEVLNRLEKVEKRGRYKQSH